jgi:hypothetical protein
MKIYSRWNPANLVFEFEGESLRGADLYGANLPTAVVVKNIDSAILAAIQAPGCSLNMDTWHICDTTHCRAGWAIHLAGPSGKVLEDVYGPSVAGALIYAASSPGNIIPDFHCSNDAAIADLKARAEKEIKLAGEA